MYSFSALVDILDKINHDSINYLNNNNFSDISLLSTITSNVQQCHKILNTLLDDPSEIINKHIQILRPLQSIIEFAINTYDFTDIDNEVLELLGQISDLIYDCSKIFRARKIITSFYNDLIYIEPLINSVYLLISNKSSWSLIYTLTLWLSLLILVPLKLENIDSNGNLTKKIVDFCIYGLNQPNKISDSCSFLLSYYLSRESYKFLDTFSSIKFDNEFIKIGTLSTIKRFLKLITSDTTDIVAVNEILNSIDYANNSIAHKLYLSAKCRLILLSINLSNVLDLSHFIDELTQGLESQFNIVRWAAAKSLGRLSKRLHTGVALEIVSYTFNLNSIHGKCLSIGEIIRSGQLININHDVIDKIIDIGISSLNVNPKSTKNVSNIIDSGCFLFWSIAVTFKPECLTFQHKLLIVQSLVNSCLFEQSINSRRAASASLQEFLGRMGYNEDPIPNSLELATMLDYYSIYNQFNTYTKLAIDVAKLDYKGLNYYCISLLDHLLNYKLFHTNLQIRILSSICIENLYHLLPNNYLIDKIPGYILELYKTKTTNVEKHGILLLINSIIQFPGFSDQLISDICIIPANAEKMLLFKSIDLIREQVCNLIRNIYNYYSDELTKQADVDIGRIRPKLVPIEDLYNKIIIDSLKSFSLNVQISAAQSIHFIMNDETLSLLCNGICSSGQSVNVLRGYAIALGYLSDNYVNKNYQFLITSLCDAIDIDLKRSEMKDAQFRQYCLVTLSCILDQITNIHCLYGELIDKIVEILVKSCSDYDKDERGDVGSWVRESCMEVIALFIYKINSDEYSNAEYIAKINCKLLYCVIGACLEKLERVRSRALWLLHCIISNKCITSQNIKDRIYYNKNYETYPDEFVKLSIYLHDYLTPYILYMGNYLTSVIEVTVIDNSPKLNIITSKQFLNVGLRLDGYSRIETAFNTVSNLLLDDEFVSCSLYKISLLLASSEYHKPLSKLINNKISNNIASKIISFGLNQFPINSLIALEFLIINSNLTIDFSQIFDIISKSVLDDYNYLKAKIGLLLSIVNYHGNVNNILKSIDLLLKYLTHKYPTIRQLVVDGLVLFPCLNQKMVEISRDVNFMLLKLDDQNELSKASDAVDIIKNSILENYNII